MVVQAGEGTEHETYKKGQHLKGVDAANAERVRAEMVSAHIPCIALAACGLMAHLQSFEATALMKPQSA